MPYVCRKTASATGSRSVTLCGRSARRPMVRTLLPTLYPVGLTDRSHTEESHMLKYASIFTTLLATAAAIGCSDSSDDAPSYPNDSSQAPAAQVLDTCRTRCDFLIGCGQECECIERDDYGLARSDFMAETQACFANAECAEDKTDCFTPVADKLIPGWQEEGSPFRNCRARKDECNTFSDDWCPAFVWSPPADVKKLEACIAKPCDEVTECLKELSPLGVRGFYFK